MSKTTARAAAQTSIATAAAEPHVTEEATQFIRDFGHTAEIRRDAAGEWRWRIVRDEDQLELCAGAGFESAEDALDAARENMPTAVAAPVDRGPRTPASIVAALWDAAEGNLDREQLEWFARAGAEAYESAQNLTRVMAGVGCLIASDSDGRVGAGSFQDGSDALALLTTFAESLDAISGMMYVASAATAELLDAEG